MLSTRPEAADTDIADTEGVAVRTIESTAPNSLISYRVLIFAITGIGLAVLVSSSPPLLALGAVFAMVLLLLFLHNPQTGILALVVARASSDAALIYGGGAVGGVRGSVHALLSPNAGLILILILAGGLFALSRRVVLFSLPGGRLFAFLLLVGFIGIMGSHRTLLGFNYWLPLLAGFIIYGIVAHVFRKPVAIQRVIDAIALSFAVPAIEGFYQLARRHSSVHLSQLPGEPPFRANGTFLHPNAFAVYLVMIFAVFLCQAIAHSGKRRLMAISIVASSAILLVATYGRAAWLGALVVLLTVGLLRERKLLLIIPLCAALAVGIPSISARLVNPLGGSFADRLTIWHAMIDTWKAKTIDEGGGLPTTIKQLFGLGPGATDDLIAGAYGGKAIAAHDDYLLVMIEYGLVGVAAYVALSLTLVISAYRAWRRSSGSTMFCVPLSFLALTLAYPLISATGNVLQHTQNQVYFWTLAGLSVAVSRMRRPLKEDYGRRAAFRDDRSQPAVATP